MRVANRLLALVLSVAVILAAVILVIEVVAHRVNADPVLADWPAWYRWAGRTSWSEAAVRLTGIGLAVLGLILLLAQLKPRRPARLAVRSANPATDAAISRRSVVSALRTAVADVDGVSDTTVKLRRRRARITAGSRGTADAGTGSLRETVTSTAQNAIEGLRLAKPPALSVKITTKES